MELPSLRRRPSYNTILQTLQSLQLKPLTWDDPAIIEAVESRGPREDESANAFLISVIMSEFEWLRETKDETGAVLSVDDQKEKLIEEASSRMSERCGRSGIIPSNYQT